MPLVLRLTKGSELTFSELDGNFSFLDNKIDGVESDLLEDINRQNYLINGDFRVWQRGQSFSGVSGGDYTADRWIFTTNTDDTVNVNRTTISSTSSVDPQPEFAAEVSVTAGTSGTTNDFSQRVENVEILQDQAVVLSYWARVDPEEEITLNTRVIQNFGSGGSGTTVALNENETISPGWTKFTHAFTLDDLDGETVGSDSYLQVLFRLPANDSYTFVVTNVKLERGTEATDFEPRPLQQEIALCERYFQKSYDLDTDPGTANSHFGVITGYYDGGSRSSDDNHDLADMFTQFRTKMRSTPTMVLYNPNDGTAGEVLRRIAAGTATYDVGAIANSSGFSVTMEDASWSSDFNVLMAHYTAEAEL